MNGIVGAGSKGSMTKCAPVADPVATQFKGYANISSGDEDALTRAVAVQGIVDLHGAHAHGAMNTHTHTQRMPISRHTRA